MMPEGAQASQNVDVIETDTRLDSNLQAAHLVLPIYFLSPLPSSKAISPEAVPTSSSGWMTWAHLPSLGTSSFRSNCFSHLVLGLEGRTLESYGIPSR